METETGPDGAATVVPDGTDGTDDNTDDAVRHALWSLGMSSPVAALEDGLVDEVGEALALGIAEASPKAAAAALRVLLDGDLIAAGATTQIGDCVRLASRALAELAVLTTKADGSHRGLGTVALDVAKGIALMVEGGMTERAGVLLGRLINWKLIKAAAAPTPAAGAGS